MSVRAKLVLSAITSHSWNAESKTLKFSTQYDQTIPEDQRFQKATPSGEFSMQVDNPRAAVCRRPTCCATAAGRASRRRTVTRIGFGGSTLPHSGTTCGLSASSHSRRLETRTTRNTSTPLQLDVIDRIITLWSNPRETVLTPFMGVGSEIYGAVMAGRRGVGIELKASYYRQAIRNVEAATRGGIHAHQSELEGIGA